MQILLGRYSLRLTILALVSSVTASAAGAQTGWLPRTVNMGPNLTGANRAAAIARLESIERLLKQVPELAHPEGFEIRPFFTGTRSRFGLNESEHSDYAVEYIYRINFFVPKLAPDVAATGTILFAVNANENMGYGDLVDSRGGILFVEQSRWPLIPFSVATYGVSGSGRLQPGEDFSLWAWFTPGGELPWRAVSREDWYNGLLASYEGKNGDKRAAIEKLTEKTPYQRWLEEAPKRKADREEVLKTLARVQPPADVAKLRKELEEAERDAGEQLKKGENDDRERDKSMFRNSDDLRAELNRMTPEQRKLPAIIDTDPTRTEWRATGSSMRDRDTLTATVHRVLTPNYDLWRARKSVADVRTINVFFEGAPSPVVTNAIYQTVKKFDWRALAALVDQPPEK
jgi:hypothetical protein